jgi:hypothetical protein
VGVGRGWRGKREREREQMFKYEKFDTAENKAGTNANDKILKLSYLANLELVALAETKNRPFDCEDNSFG